MKATLLYEPEIKGTPIPESSVLGVEAPLWAEWVPTDRDVDRMIYPGCTHLRNAAGPGERL